MASPVTGEGTVLPLGFTEFKDSGQEDYNFRDGKAEFQRIFDGPWENRQQFIFDHVLPSIQSAEGETFLHVPQRYPAFRQAIPYRATVKGMLRTTRAPALENLISHDIARITVYYSTIQAPSQNSGGGGGDINFVEESVDSEIEILPLPAQKFEYQFHYFNGTPTNYETYLAHGGSPGIIKLTKKATEEGKINHIIRRLNYRIKVPFITQPRWGYISTYQGSLNSAPFITPSGLFAAPGQLRFDGISSVTKRELQDITNPQATGWEFDFVFCYYKPGWNTHPTTAPIDPNITENADLTLALRDLPPEQTKIRHAAIIPPLFPYKFHQLIFANVPVIELLNWQRWFFDRPPEIIKRFYDPDDPLDFTVQEYLEFINADVARPLWVA
jgi:hypothetical protein